jgi:hypothetical protein
MLYVPEMDNAVFAIADKHGAIGAVDNSASYAYQTPVHKAINPCFQVSLFASAFPF